MAVEALKHIADLLNAAGACEFTPAELADDEYPMESNGGYQPMTIPAQLFLKQQGGGWADGAGWVPPDVFEALPRCAACGERFSGAAGPCRGEGAVVVEGLPLHSRTTWRHVT